MRLRLLMYGACLIAGLLIKACDDDRFEPEILKDRDRHQIDTSRKVIRDTIELRRPVAKYSR